MSDWQSIESAPENKIVLVSDGEDVDVAVLTKEGWRSMIRYSWHGDETIMLEMVPTYWMLFPRGPEDAQ